MNMLSRIRGVSTQWARGQVVFDYFRNDVRKRRAKLIAGMSSAVVYAIARVAEPWPLKVVFDQVLFHKPAHGAWAAPFTVFGTSAYGFLTAAGLVLAVTGLVRGVSYYYEDYLLSSAAQEIVYAVRSRLYRHLHRLPLAFHQSRRTGDTLLRLSSDIILLRDVLVDTLANVGTGLILIVLMGTVMLLVDPVLTGVALVVMPLIVLLSALYGHRIRHHSRKQRKREGEIAAAMHEALAAMDVVQLHGAGVREEQRFHTLNRKSLKRGAKAVRLEAQMNRGVELALAGGTAVVLWVGTLRALHGAITPGELIVFISYLRGAYRPLRRISKTVQRSAKALAAAERIVEVLEVEPQLKDSLDAREAPPFRGRIVFDDVDFSYTSETRALERVTFAVEAGASVAIVGPTGSGKSTLLSLIPRLYDADRGRITIDGFDVRELTLDSLRAQVSVVRQETILFGLTVAENIRYGYPEASDDEVRAAAQAAGLEEVIDQLPDGYETILSERGSSLSGGQRQRVALARALIRKAPILLLDEPTTGLDPATQRDVRAAMRELTRETTTILVTHDLALAREADEVLVLDRGRIEAQGSYEHLIASSPHFRRLALRGELPVHAANGHRGVSKSDGSRVLFYSHNGVGVGHLQRQLDLARAFRARHPNSALLLATGSHAAGMFEIPDGIDLVKLPSLVMTDRYRTWEPRNLPLRRDSVVRMRSQLLDEAVAQFAPDLLVADFMPSGPYDELVGALERLERSGGRAVVGFRDIVDEPHFVQQLWEENGSYETMRHYYDALCVYGDPRMLDFVDSYALDETLATRVHYCGYLGRRPQRALDVPIFERPLVLASCGGGADGAAVIEAFIGAARRLRGRTGGTWLAVTGPLMPYGEHRRLAELGNVAGIEVRRSVPELRSHVAAADCVVCMPGYNTACDLLTHRLRSVVVPRQGPSQEQRLRARRLAEWGVARVLEQPKLGAEALALAIENALGGPPPAPAPVPLDGLEEAVDVFTRTLETGAPTAATEPRVGSRAAGSRDEALSPELVLVSPPELAEHARVALPLGQRRAFRP
jgi:ATP-binding cassette subfamily B protein